MKNKKYIIYDEMADCLSPAMLAIQKDPAVTLMSLNQFKTQKIVFSEEDQVVLTSETLIHEIIDQLDEGRRKMVNNLKNKISWRNLLQDLYPNFEFHPIKHEREVPDLNKNKAYILKPAEGFGGIGAQKFQGNDDFTSILATKIEEVTAWSQKLKGVYSVDQWIVESFEEGEIICTDAYYDGDSSAKIAGLYRRPIHYGEEGINTIWEMYYEDFLSLTNKITDELNYIGNAMKLRNLPVFFEFILKPDGTLLPMDLNVIRFCSFGGHNLAFDAFNINPFYAYFNNMDFNWNEVWKGKQHLIYQWELLKRTNQLHAPNHSREVEIEEMYGEKLMSVSLFKQDYHLLDASCIIQKKVQ